MSASLRVHNYASVKTFGFFGPSGIGVVSLVLLLGVGSSSLPGPDSKDLQVEVLRYHYRMLTQARPQLLEKQLCCAGAAAAGRINAISLGSVPRLCWQLSSTESLYRVANAIQTRIRESRIRPYKHFLPFIGFGVDRFV